MCPLFGTDRYAMRLRPWSRRSPLRFRCALPSVSAAVLSIVFDPSAFVVVVLS
jgi:hypothetical protein